MKISAIDVGSNSVRLALIADGKTLYKRLKTTRLAEGVAIYGRLLKEAMERTALAIAEFVSEAKADGADKVYVFGTAAVRAASNREEFLALVKERSGVDLEVVSGENEAKLGVLGALGTKDGGIIDVGGASSEVSVQKGGKKLYTKSVDIGTVRLSDIAGRDFEKLEKACLSKVEEYGSFNASAFDMYAIGGTATTLASVKHGLKVYDPSITDGTVLYADEIYQKAQYILSLPVEEVRKISGMEPRRADVIGGGCLLTAIIMRRFNVQKVTVSERDNLEGYIMLKEGLDRI